MKIINQLTLRYLKQNKKRSILTILCIMVSVIMVSCVGIAFYSGQQFYKDYIERTVGDYHYHFVTDNQEFLDTLAKDSKIEEYYFSSTMPYYGDNQLESNTFFAYKKDYYNNLNQFLKQNDKVDNYYFMSNLTAYVNIDPSYLDIPVSSSQDFQITLVGLSENKRKELFEENDLKYNQNQVLVYNGTYINEEGKEYSQRFHKIDNQLMKEIYIGDIEYDENGEERINHKVKLKNFESLEFIKKNDFLKYLNINEEMEIFFIVPMDYIQQIDLKYTSIPMECHIFSTQHQELTKELENLNYSAYDYAQSVSENRQIFIIIQIFVYGFVCIMIVFAMLNIINMMSASIDKRKRELGMLLSVRMSPKDISKMLFYESFIYGLKTLLYGIPICIGIEWIFYKQMSSDTVFVPSFMAYVIAFVVIMIVMFITFRVGLMKFRKQNIIETLKEDM